MDKQFLCPRCKNPLDNHYACTSCGHAFKDEIETNAGRETLTNAQMEALDLMDNACGELIRQYAPDFEHDAEQVAIIREALLEVLGKFHKIPEYDVYPWLLTPEEPASHLVIK